MPSLFDPEPAGNLLPCDGEVYYYGPVIGAAEANRYLDTLLHNIAWKNDEAIIFGKHLVTKRKVAWYADTSYSYTYSNTTRHALPWTTELLELKALVEKHTDRTYNSCLLNLYHNGDEGMAWHSDDEKELVAGAGIASLSFGAPRKFALKHRYKDLKTSLILERGGLLLMAGSTQQYWLHSLPKSKKIMTPRINLTFRTMLK